ncbi:MAG: sterol desaturase family protein [Polyangiaceae bacterium]
MFELAVIIAAILAFDAVLLGYLAWAFHAQRFADRRLSPSVSLRVPQGERLRTMAVSSTLSLVTIIGALTFAHRFLVTTAPTSIGRMIFQAAAILVIYDFVYYWLHRTMHIQALMRFVHGIHHRAKNPSALESFYLHPAELLAGLALLMLSTWIVGPVHVYAFAVCFFIYSTLNILIHSGLQFGHPLLRPIDALTAKHYVHHMTDHHKNYSSLTPLPDFVFRTAGSLTR